MKIIFSIIIYYTLSLLGAAQASDFGEGIINQSNSRLLKNADKKYTHWSGIGKIFKKGHPLCTASLIDTRSPENNATGPAYLLTAGHCVSQLSHAVPFTNQPFAHEISFNYFNDTLDQLKTYKIHKANWTSMVGTDVAILELEASLATLLLEGIEPLKLAASRPVAISNVLNIGAPATLAENGLRLSACSQEAAETTLIEQPWVFTGTLKNQCKDLLPGSSGSPMLDRTTNEITAVLFLSSRGTLPENKCHSPSPCEVNEGQPNWFADTHYSAPVDYLQGCFTKGVFNITAESCTLEPQYLITPKNDPIQYARRHTNEQGVIEYPTWDFSFTSSTPFYRYKTTRNAINCESPNNYSGAISSENAKINNTLGPESGMHILCILGVVSKEQPPSLGMLRNAKILAAQLVEPGPVPLPNLNISLGADWNYQVRWFISTPENTDIYYYAGPPDTTDCNTIDDEAYMETLDVITFSAEQLPLKLCSVALDMAGKSSSPREDLLALP